MKLKMVLLLFLVICFTCLCSCESNHSITHETDDEKAIADVYNDFESAYPNLVVNKELTKTLSHVGKDNSLESITVTIFLQGDRGFGYNYIVKDNIIKNDFDINIYKARLELIEYMNKVMPTNSHYNSLVHFYPHLVKTHVNNKKQYGLIYEYDKLKYVVVNSPNTVKDQLNIDYLIHKKAEDILIEQYKTKLIGSKVTYLTTESNEPYKLTNSLYIDFKHYCRSTEYMKLSKEYELKAEYELYEYNFIENKSIAVNVTTRNNFITTVRDALLSNRNLNYNSKKILLENLLSQRDKTILSLNSDIVKFNDNIIEDINSYDGNFADASLVNKSNEIVFINRDTNNISFINRNGTNTGIIKQSYHSQLFTEAKQIIVNSEDDIACYNIGSSFVKVSLTNKTRELYHTLGDIESRELVSNSKNNRFAILFKNNTVKVLTNTTYTVDPKNTIVSTIYLPKKGFDVYLDNKQYNISNGDFEQKIDGIRSVITYTYDGKYYLAKALHSDNVELYEANSNKKLHSYPYSGYLTDLVISSDKQYLITSSTDFTIRVYELESGRLIDSYRNSKYGYPVSIDINEQNEFLVCFNGKLKLFKIR